MSTRKKAFLLALVFITSAGMFFIFLNNLREAVILPLQYIFWLSRLVFHSLSQLVFWVCLLAIVALAMLRSLLESRTASGPDRPFEPESRRVGRVSYWANQVRRVHGNVYPREYIDIEFRKLILTVLSYRMNLSAHELRKRLKTGELEIPPELQRLFERRQLDPPEPGNDGYFSRMKSRLKALVRGPQDEDSQPTDQELEVMIRFMEEKLEIYDDDQD
jgi:hypothetical protein